MNIPCNYILQLKTKTNNKKFLPYPRCIHVMKMKFFVFVFQIFNIKKNLINCFVSISTNSHENNYKKNFKKITTNSNHTWRYGNLLWLWFDLTWDTVILNLIIIFLKWHKWLNIWERSWYWARTSGTITRNYDLVSMESNLDTYDEDWKP